MNSIDQRKHAFTRLGEYLLLLTPTLIKSEQSIEILEKLDASDKEKLHSAHEQILEYIQYSTHYNTWFTQEFLLSAIHSIGESLALSKMNQWLEKYESKLSQVRPPKTIGVVMAGNLPLVGFHDYLSVLISGNNLLAKLSHSDNKLLPLIHQVLVSFEPSFEGKAAFTEHTLKDFYAIIATGSGNTARYFEYYFGKYPNIIRKNRNGVAILNGKETTKELEGLADDVFMYFGLGCRNVSKLFVPKEYDFETLFLAFKKYEHIAHHNKYTNNYDYNKSIFMVNKIKYLDNGFVLLKEESSFSSPISVLYYEYYDNSTDLLPWIETQKDKIQCLISSESFENIPTLSLGKAQQPELWDYADGVNTLEFLFKLS